MRKAKIVATLGPASNSREVIQEMVEAGMGVARFNTSHGTVSERAELIDTVQSIGAALDVPLATMLDLRGPEIRVADVDRSVSFAPGDEVRFVSEPVLTADRIGVTVDLNTLTSGTTVLLDDGRLSATVNEIYDDAVLATIETGGELRGGKGVNIPGVSFDHDFVTDADQTDLDLAAEKSVDFVAASFVENGEDVLSVNEALEDRGAKIPIIAKIERDLALANIDEIIEAAYGIMVARGDLGVECHLEEVPIIQKRLISKCRQRGTPVITATEMLDSMITENRPTRAEASDVANAVLDGTDAVMLSGETAVGERPIAVIESMSKLIETVEESEEYQELLEQRIPTAEKSHTDALARSARFLARDINASAIVVASESGFTALKTTKFRPGVPIIAVTPDDHVRRRLMLSWGIRPQFGVLADEPGGVIHAAVDAALDGALIEAGDTIVAISGVMSGVDRETANTLQIHIASERLAVGIGVVAGDVAGPVVRSTDGVLTGIPDGAVLYLSESFEGELEGDLDRLGGIIHERHGMTGYPAMIARELGIPMASGISLPSEIEPGEVVTLYGDRGVVYRGDVLDQARPPTAQ